MMADTKEDNKENKESDEDKSSKHIKHPKLPSHPKGSDIIKLNVGGVPYLTTKTTLCQPGSYFEIMFSGKMEPGIQIDGAHFIDRDGMMFRYVINYMRDLDKWLPPSDIDTLSQLIKEAQYYCLNGMLEMMKEMVPTKQYTFEVYFRTDGYGQIVSINYFAPPVKVKAYLDSLTITKDTPVVSPPLRGVIKHLINKVDSKYELYYCYPGLDGMITLGFRNSTERIALSHVQRALGLYE